jgi:hypothetical protein
VYHTEFWNRMFSPSMDSARDVGGVVTAGTVLIPVRFVWPYGGRTVYLSGSFTRYYTLILKVLIFGSKALILFVLLLLWWFSWRFMFFCCIFNKKNLNFVSKVV